MAQANALFNQCYFVSINGVGTWGGGRSMIIDPDGRILQQAGTNQTFITEIIDLDQTTRTREFGTLGSGADLETTARFGTEVPGLWE
jgi:deaminated glutathione amidase